MRARRAQQWARRLFPHSPPLERPNRVQGPWTKGALGSPLVERLTSQEKQADRPAARGGGQSLRRFTVEDTGWKRPVLGVVSSTAWPITMGLGRGDLALRLDLHVAPASLRLPRRIGGRREVHLHAQRRAHGEMVIAHEVGQQIV